MTSLKKDKIFNYPLANNKSENILPKKITKSGAHVSQFKFEVGYYFTKNVNESGRFDIIIFLIGCTLYMPKTSGNHKG